MHAAIVARWCHVSSLYTSRIDKTVGRAHHAAMTNDKAPDNATGDSVTNAELITRVHAFMVALLTFLGFNILPTETVFDMLDTLTQWLADAKRIRRDPQGATARIWWDAFKEAWKDSCSSEAAKSADAAAAEFGKRFLPVADEHDRDTFDTADFEALRTECNRLDANIAILESRADDLQQNLDAIVAERNALLKTNAHHSNEIEVLRQERDKLKKLRSDDLLEMASVANALDGVRAAILAPSLPDDEVAGAIRQIVGERDALHVATRDALGWPADARFDGWAALKSIRIERDELKAQLAGAIVPLPKPERVEPGQRWAIAMTANEQTANAKFVTFTDGSGCGYTAFPEDLACSYYLGKDA